MENRNVVILFGINGVGKSKIVQHLCAQDPAVIALMGSDLLRQAFGGATREQLESFSPENKMRAKESAILSAFASNRAAHRIFLDTHLIVSVRREGRLTLENTWSSAYVPFVAQTYCILAPPEHILERRKKDLALTGRKRDMDIAHITYDQDINLEAYRRDISPMLKSMEIINPDGDLDYVVQMIKDDLARHCQMSPEDEPLAL